MTAEPHEPLTLAEFIAWELQQEDKHEFVDGYVSRLFGDPTIAGFAGGTVEHSRLAIALIERIRPAVAPCDTHGSGMLIQTTERRTRYADVVVTCDERDRARGTVILRFPKLVIEVLLESTARDDLGPKMREYHALATLEEYVTIDSRKRWAQASYREPAGTWTQLSPTTDGTLSLHSIGVDIDLDALYTGAGVLHDGHGDAAGL